MNERSFQDFVPIPCNHVIMSPNRANITNVIGPLARELKQLTSS